MGSSKSKQKSAFKSASQASKPDEDILECKIVFHGDFGVGKTSFIMRYGSDKFDPSGPATIASEYLEKRMNVDGTPIIAKLWDTAGQEKFQAITASHFQGASISVVMFDLTNKESFDNVTKWIKIAREHTHEGVPLFVVGNKSDESSLRMVKPAEPETLVNSLNSEYFETSAKTGDGVAAAVVGMVTSWHKKRQAALRG
eukprot:TRINITY_DN2980_c0_g1_i1.p1 TRINITY_DN2980_c0_g1~~TRINITY_DN2980_c0_g1_i1.p1  ORF type:complete len:199 (-),score=33.90 TRINITY_DN2980_c0_g1_i1:126-722(-)